MKNRLKNWSNMPHTWGNEQETLPSMRPVLWCSRWSKRYVPLAIYGDDNSVCLTQFNMKDWRGRSAEKWISGLRNFIDYQGYDWTGKTDPRNWCNLDDIPTDDPRLWAFGRGQTTAIFQWKRPDAWVSLKTQGHPPLTISPRWMPFTGRARWNL